MNPIVEILYLEYLIVITRANGIVNSYGRNSRRFIKLVSLTQPELLPYIKK